MKNICLMIMVAFMLLTVPLHASDPVELPELTRPSMFIVDYDRIYVLEQATVRVYSLKDYSLIKKFGRAGEGPKEFKYSADGGRPLSMGFFKDQLIVNSEMKMSFFNKDGNFLKEQKVTVDRLLFPINGKYLGIGPTANDDKSVHIGFSIFDNQFKSPQIIFISDVEMNNPNRFVLPMTSYTYKPIYKGRIYVNSSSDDFRILVFNSDGKMEYSIEKKYPRIKIPDRFYNDAMAFFKIHPNFKSAIDFFKRILVIREHYPPIRDLQIVDDHIYVLTYKRKGKLWELIRMDLKGNEKGRTFIPLSEYEYFTWYPVFYSVYKGKVYTLVDDQEEEVWKVHMTRFQ